MFSIYFKIALRNLLNHKVYSLINIFGLAVGLAACLMISLFVHYEFTYDGFFPDADRIYRISPNFEASPMGPARQPAANVAPLAPLIRSAGIPGVEKVARIGGMHALIENNEIAFFEDNVRWVDDEFFDIFQLDWLEGDKSTALAEPFSIVINESIAKKYFGTEDPMGRNLMLENTWPVRVTGVVKDIPGHSHLQADLFVSMDTGWEMMGFNYENNWAYTNFHTYIKLEEGAGIDTVMSQITDDLTSEDNALLDKRVAGFFGITKDLFSLTAYPLQAIHLKSGRAGEFKDPGSLNYIYIFSAIAACLLLIACINFMNLSTARSSQRAREVGMRKAIGANRRELIGQFFGESMLLTCLALVIALALEELLLPVFSALIERELDFSALARPSFLFFILAVTTITGLVAGSYPALYLSSFKPAKVFKYEAMNAGRTVTVRNLLVIFQFFLAISLIVATLVVWFQMRYVSNYEMGFNKDNVIELMGTHQDGMGVRWNEFKRELLQYPGIIDITEESMYPGSAGPRQVRIGGGATDGVNMLGKQVGFNFFDTFGIDLVAGRNFNEQLSTDVFNPPANVENGAQPTGSFILNETAVRLLGLSPGEAVGRNFEMDFSSDFSLTVAGPVIGVVKDVHLFSLRQQIPPMVYFVPTPVWGGHASFTSASIRMDGEHVQQTLDLIREKWREYIPDVPLIYNFLDAEWGAVYRDEQRQGQLFTLFALLTVAIACLGLFGLATFTAERRRKEIGVRKVMGGSVWSIVLLLTNDFSKLVLIANVLAWPVSYFAMNQWLSNFAYRIDLTPMIFIGSGLIALCIAWVTVGGTAAKAASQRPVLALRYE